MLRKEDPALLSGRGRYADDLPVAVDTLHAHVIRSPHAHAEILRIDPARALSHDGVWAVITGEDVRKLSDPFLASVKTPVHQWALAVERVRYVGEPVALVVAESRYIAEDAAELVQIDYEPLEAVIDPQLACTGSAPIIHPEAKTNEISVREFSLWRSGGGLRPRRSPHRHDGAVSPALVHADRMLRRRRAVQRGRTQLRRAGEFSGPVFHASGDGAGAARCRPETAAAHPAGFRRQLRHKALGVSLCGADGARRENHRPAGEMGRGPHRASGRRQFRAEPRHRNRGGGRQRRPHSGAKARSAGRLRRVLARADAGPALPHAWRGDRRLRHRTRRGEKPRRADQQNAGEPHSRFRRAAALSGLGAADGAHRGRAETRSARRHPPQSHPRAEIPVPHGGRRALRFRRLCARRRGDDRGGAACRTASAGATRRARPGASTASALPPWWSRRCRTWVTSRR